MTTFSLFDVTAGTFAKPLDGLAWVLCKVDNHYRAAGKDTAALMQDALAPDMLPFGMQVALAVQHSIGALERTLGRGDRPIKPYATLEEARKAVADAQVALKTITAVDLDAVADRKVHWDPRGDGGRDFDNAKAYLVDFTMPNFWFHYTTTYALARKNGVPVGKGDYLARGEPPEGLKAA